jgi:hypothetical protein
MKSSNGKTSEPKTAFLDIENKMMNPDRRAFDKWLDGRVKALFHAVIEEPLPDELVKLIRSSP